MRIEPKCCLAFNKRIIPNAEEQAEIVISMIARTCAFIFEKTSDWIISNKPSEKKHISADNKKKKKFFWFSSKNEAKATINSCNTNIK